MSDKITAIRVKPGNEPEIVELDNELETFQKEVGGYIEVIRPFYDPICVVLNEDGKMLGLPENKKVINKNGRLLDVLVGTILFVGLSGDEFCSLRKDLLEKYSEWLKLSFVMVDG